MTQKPKRIIINACVLSILAGFIATIGVLDNAAATLIMNKVSAFRAPNETSKEAARRNFTTNLINGTYKSVDFASTAYDQMKPFNQVDLSQTPNWSDETSLQENFKKIRDLRFVNQGKNFLRRLSWLYPDDGCFARADLERAKFEEWQLISPLKIIVSGDLNVQTSNSPTGSVTWWWHISQLIKVGNNYYVLDPAIEPSRPLLVREWLAKMTPNPDTASVAVCSRYTYNIYDDCAQTTDQQMALSEQYHFLDLEWQRQVELGRDPHKVLGHEPPWKN